jgi:dipeptidyl aminopeptidase/acylaminoacyl peptidase
MSEPVPVDLFAMRRGERLTHFYPSAALVSMCGTGTVVRVRLTPDEAGTHWCWWKRDGAVFFVHDDEHRVRICSPDGFERAERDGHGKVVRVRVDVLREATTEVR